MHRPFRRPGRMLKEVFDRGPGHGRVGVDSVVRELVDIGIGLVGYALTVTIYVDPAEAGGLDGMVAHVPDRVEDFIGTFKCGGTIIKRIVGHHHSDVVFVDGSRNSFQLGEAEGDDFSDVIGHFDGSRLRVAPIRGDLHRIPVFTLIAGQ